MKGIHGLIMALGLGIAGALFNWAYLYQKASNLEMIYFIGIKPDVTVNAGQKLTEDHLAKVGLPAESVGNLKDFAYLWSVQGSVLTRPVHRTLLGGSLLMRDDMTTPPQELALGAEPLGEGEEERLMWVPIETRSFVTSLVSPGDQVDFLLPGSGSPTPAEAGPPPEGAPKDAPPPTSVQILGPFKILALGNRLWSSDIGVVGKASTQENVIGVSVKLRKGELEPKAQKLWNLLNATNFKQVGVMLRPRKHESK